MKRFALLLLPLFLAGVAPGYADDAQRAQKIREEGGKLIEPFNMPLSTTAATGGWLPQVVDQASITYGGAQYLSPGVVYLSGYTTTADYLYRSYDNGGSWTRLAVPTNNAGFVFAARDSNMVVAGTFQGLIVRSTNGGTTWDSVYKHVDYIDGLVFVGKDTLVACGDRDAGGPLLIRSTNAGQTWTRLPLPSAADSAMSFTYATYRQGIAAYQNTVWVTTYKSGVNSRIMKSTDAGSTWSSWEVPLTGGPTQNYYLRSINFVNDSIGFAVDRQVASGLANYVHRTTNGGLTWSDTLSLQAGAHSEANARSAKVIPGTNSVLVLGSNSAGSSARMWISPDLGLTFNPVPVLGVNLTNSALLDSTHMYAVGGGSTVLKFTGKIVRKVTFNLNTATVPDTLPVTGAVTQIRGGVNHAGGFSPITWGNDAQNNLTRVGGDYWKKDLYMQVGDTLSYKYVIQLSGADAGWESGVVPANFPSQTNGNRSYIVADKDTVLPVEFWNNGANTNPQYFRPWTAVPDSMMTVYFRVNMMGPISSGTFGFNNDTDTVGVRGGGPAGSDLNWAPTFYLKREGVASNWAGTTVPPVSFWSGALRFPKSKVNVGDSLFYKFLIGYDWGRDELGGGAPNRKFLVPADKKDTTLYFAFYNNERPTVRANPDTVAITFRVNVAQTAASGGFNVTSDTIQVRTGYFSTTNDPGRTRQMVRVSGTIFQFADTVVTAKNKAMDYQYYVMRAGVEGRENYYNFNYSGPTPSEAERRQFLIPTTASKTQMTFVYDTSTSITQDRRQPIFPNSRVLARKVRVRYEVDLRPAYYTLAWGDSLFDVQSAFRTLIPQDKDSVQKWGVWMNGLAVGAWSNPTGNDWGQGLRDNLDKKMYDNGANGDRVANDSIWSRFVLCAPESIAVGNKGRVGQVFKFGVYGGDNEGGRGGFGNNHAANIVDTDTAYTIADQFGSINPKYYRFWDYDNKRPKVPTAVGGAPVPLTFDLSQNYPNPFNPATQITYSLPVQSKVELKVFNVLGQVVATLVDEVKPAGAYTARFDATNFATGMYIYKFQAGSFSSVKKMLLVK